MTQGITTPKAVKNVVGRALGETDSMDPKLGPRPLLRIHSRVVYAQLVLALNLSRISHTHTYSFCLLPSDYLSAFSEHIFVTCSNKHFIACCAQLCKGSVATQLSGQLQLVS